ncbi:serine/threonine-protein kinase MARK2-like [Rhinolophus ferrumequinum]|uniref:serine/threonine-protein kinase MARK2-like n=1 Tax=Rhinolophus ferrumequinum TaxID=59479 RepID=UPI00140FC1FB|nr:serine/threonine-protein kinase MARK2-like [Rhinolophus ferrumequinum]
MMKIRNGQYFVPTYLSTQVANLLQKLLNLHPRQRDNLRDIMSDPWINMGQEEELKPYVEPPSDVIDTWVMEEMVNLGFGEEDIKNALGNKIYNNILATYRILHRKNLKYQHRIIKVKPFHPPEFQSRSPSPAQEVQSELSGCKQAEQLPMDQEPGEKAGQSTSPTYTQDYSTAISQSRTTLPPSRPGSKTAIPEPSRKSRNDTPEPPPPKHCWGSRTSTSQHSQGSRYATPDERSGSTTAIPEERSGSWTAIAEPSQGSRTATPEERSGSTTAIPEPSRGSRTATPEERSGSTTAIPEPSRGSRTTTPEERSGSRTATPELSPGSSTILSPAPQCHPGDSLSSNSTTSSRGNQQKIKPRRRQVVTGCLNFLRKVFCLPPKKGS